MLSILYDFWKKCIAKSEREPVDQRLLELERLISDYTEKRDVDENVELVHIPESSSYNQLTTVDLEELECQSCTASIKTILSNKKGIDAMSIEVSLLPPKVKLRHDDSLISVDMILDILEKAKYKTGKYTTFKIPVSEEINSVAEDDDSRIVIRIEGKVTKEMSESIKNFRENCKGTSEVKFDGKHRLYMKYDYTVVNKREILNWFKRKNINAYIEDITTRREELESMNKTTRKMLMKIVHSSIVWFPITIFNIIEMFMPKDNYLTLFFSGEILPGISLRVLLLFICGTFIQFYLGYPLYLSTYKSFFRGFLDMNCLIALSTSVAYLYFIYQILSGKLNDDNADYSFLDSSSYVILFTSIGKYLELKACHKMSFSIRNLFNIIPANSTLVVPSLSPHIPEQQISIPTNLIEKNYLLKVFRGHNFPCDGFMFSGETLVDESSVTGESGLVQKKEGDYVSCGTLNSKRNVIIKALRVSNQTSLSKIISMIEQAQNTRSSIQILADKISQYFMPTIVLLSAFTFLYWYIYLSNIRKPNSLDGNTPLDLSITFAISVLVIACPCSVGLAMPTASFVGANLCTKYNILPRGGGNVFELASKMKAIAFDKTNTLTTGDIKCSDNTFFINNVNTESIIDSGFNLSPFETLKILLEIINDSSHPLSAPISKLLTEKIKYINVNDVEFSGNPYLIISTVEKYGCGLVSKVKFENSDYIYTFYLGNVLFLTQDMKLDINQIPGVTDFINSSLKHGDTIVLVGVTMEVDSDGTLEYNEIERKLIAMMSFYNEVRPEARKVISELKNMNIDTYIITGDNHASALVVANKIGISECNVFSESTPTSKKLTLNSIKNFYNKRNNSSVVAMVGDGINDSLAIASADFSIAIGSGSEIALGCAHVILVRSNLTDILRFYDISKFVYKRIKFNFFWAFAYNIIFIPVAMGLLYNRFGIVLKPSISALLMTTSSISVLLSSFLIKRYKPAVY